MTEYPNTFFTSLFIIGKDYVIFVPSWDSVNWN
jgi:hypothetical protein